MALPTVLVNSATGSDTQASGAGPSTALFGTTDASTDGTGLIVTLTASTDLTNVAVDGSHVIFLEDTTAGARNFGKITAKAGSGGATPTVTVSDAFGLSLSGKSWAIGGKRASIGATTTRKFFENNGGVGDAMPGWTMEMESGHAETLSAQLSWRRSGTVATGPITLKGTLGAATPPILTFSHNGTALAPNNTFQRCLDFELRNTNATKTASTALLIGSNATYCERIRIDHVTDKFWKGIVGGGTVINCRIGNCANFGIDLTATGRVLNSYIFTNGSHGINSSVTENAIIIRGNIIYDNVGDGLRQLLSGATASRGIVIDGNVFVSNDSDGIEFTGGASAIIAGTLVLLNNILSSNGGYGINLTTNTLAEWQAQSPTVSGNNTYANTSGAFSPSGLDPTDLGLDPQFTNAAGEDFSIGTNLKAKGFPVGGTLRVGLLTSTYSYVDIGAAQRPESAAQAGTVIGQGVRRSSYF